MDGRSYGNAFVGALWAFALMGLGGGIFIGVCIWPLWHYVITPILRWLVRP